MPDMGVVINGRVAWEATKDMPGAFYHKGAWYIWDRKERRNKQA